MADYPAACMTDTQINDAQIFIDDYATVAATVYTSVADVPEDYAFTMADGELWVFIVVQPAHPGQPGGVVARPVNAGATAIFDAVSMEIYA